MKQKGKAPFQQLAENLNAIFEKNLSKQERIKAIIKELKRFLTVGIIAQLRNIDEN